MPQYNLKDLGGQAQRVQGACRDYLPTLALDHQVGQGFPILIAQPAYWHTFWASLGVGG